MDENVAKMLMAVVQRVDVPRSHRSLARRPRSLCAAAANFASRALMVYGIGSDLVTVLLLHAAPMPVDARSFGRGCRYFDASITRCATALGELWGPRINTAAWSADVHESVTHLRSQRTE
jgi:hypothetical protein